MTDPHVETQDPTESYQSHGYPLYLKLLFVVLIIWGVLFAGYYLMAGYDSEAEFDQAAKTAAQPAVVAVAAEQQPLDAAAGEELYAKRCRACHGAKGKGGVGPDLTRQKYLFGREPEAVVQSIGDGRPGGMPAFKTQLSAAEISALTEYILALP